MRLLPSSLAPAGYSPARLNTLSIAKASDKGQRLADLMAIKRLFANGEQGGYWPADPAYMFEDSAGTIPASVNGVVGLRFDVSKDLKLGPNIFLNSSFSDNSAWSSASTGTGTFSIADGVAAIIGTTGSNRGAFTQSSLTTGAFYKVTANAVVVSGAMLAFGAAVGTGGIVISSSREISQLVFGGGNSGTYFYTINTGGNGKFDNVTAQLLLGNHAIQATTGNKPYLRQTPVSNKFWLDSNTSTGALTATFSGSLGSACTIATVGAEGVTIAENQTVDTTYNLTPPFSYNGDVLIINRALTAAEKALVTRVMGRNVPGLGSELVTNGGFDTDISGWLPFIVSTGTITWNSGTAQVSVPDGGASRAIIKQDISVGANPYILKYSITSSTTGTYFSIKTTDEATTYYSDIQTIGNKSIVLISPISILRIMYSAGIVAGNTGTLDNVTMKPIL